MKQQSHLIEVLVKVGALQLNQVERLYHEQRQWGGRFTQLIVELGFLREDMLVRILSQELRIPAVAPERLRTISKDTLGVLPVSTCENFEIIPFSMDVRSRRLSIAMADPSDAKIIQEIQEATGLEVEPFIAPLSLIRRVIRMHFYGEGTAELPRARDPQGHTMVGQRSHRVSESTPAPRRNPGVSAEYQTGTLPPRRPPGPTGARRGQPHMSSATPLPRGFQPSGSTPVPRTRSGHTGSGTYKVSPGHHPSGMHNSVGQPKRPEKRSDWFPTVPSTSHPASLELDAAMEVVGQKPQRPPTNPVAHRVPTHQLAEELQRELLQVRKEFQLFKEQAQGEVEAMQELLRKRSQEQRLLMRALFDLLVAKGYLRKDELVQMLSHVAEKQDRPSS